MLHEQLERALPAVRRYARGLVGDQQAGDALVVSVVERFLLETVSNAREIKMQLFRILHRIWVESLASRHVSPLASNNRAQVQRKQLTPLSREALLLHAIEDMSHQAISKILDVDVGHVDSLLADASAEIKQAAPGRILVIEDEALIAMDLQDILTGAGHRVIGAAATHEQAIALTEAEHPDLILADIQLADGSSGIEATDEILKTYKDLPVIFVTAFPELLLTGKRHEPAFVIAKPYNQLKVTSAVSQAMFFADVQSGPR